VTVHWEIFCVTYYTYMVPTIPCLRIHLQRVVSNKRQLSLFGDRNKMVQRDWSLLTYILVSIPQMYAGSLGFPADFAVTSRSRDVVSACFGNFLALKEPHLSYRYNKDHNGNPSSYVLLTGALCGWKTPNIPFTL